MFVQGQLVFYLGSDVLKYVPDVLGHSTTDDHTICIWGGLFVCSSFRFVLLLFELSR